MKTNFSSDNDLRLKKTLELHNMKMIVRGLFHKGNKF